MLSGSELIIDAKDCKGVLNDKSIYELFIDELCYLCNMKKVGELVAEYFDYNDYNICKDLCGYTIIQVISVSSITLHIAEISKTIYFNFHTCNELNQIAVIELFKKFFKPSVIKSQIIERNVNNLIS